MFVHVETRRRRQWQWATLLLVCLCVLCFIVLATLPLDRRLAVLLAWGTVPANIFDAHDPLWPQLTDPSLLRLFTALFIHVTWLQVAGGGFGVSVRTA